MGFRFGAESGVFEASFEGGILKVYGCGDSVLLELDLQIKELKGVDFPRQSVIVDGRLLRLVNSDGYLFDILPNYRVVVVYKSYLYYSSLLGVYKDLHAIIYNRTRYEGTVVLDDKDNLRTAGSMNLVVVEFDDRLFLTRKERKLLWVEVDKECISQVQEMVGDKRIIGAYLALEFRDKVVNLYVVNTYLQKIRADNYAVKVGEGVSE